MNFMTILLQAQGGNGGAGNYSFIIMMVVIFAIMYFFMIRPQNKKQKEIMNFRRNLAVGQEVVTAGGIYGKIKEIEDTAVILEIASGVKIKIDKNSIYADAPSTQQNAK
jgi:preprotein translocase subunit YajC